MTNLENLTLEGVGLKNIEFISNLKQLNNVNVSHNQIEDITPLSSLENLQWLNLEDNHIKDVTVIGSMLNLFSLNLAGNEIRDVRPLIQLGQWGTIDVRRQKVILDDAEINKEVKIPVYDLEGERIEKITLKSAGGMLTDEGIIWSTLGEKIYEFDLDADHYETGILYSGIVMQNIVEKLIPKEEVKEPEKEVEETKEEVKETIKEVEEEQEEVKEPIKEVEEVKEEVDEPTTGVEEAKAEIKGTGKEIEGSKDAVNQSTVVQEQNVNNQVVKENKPVVNKQEESKKSLGATGGQENTSTLLSGIALVLSAMSMFVFRKRLFKK